MPEKLPPAFDDKEWHNALYLAMEPQSEVLQQLYAEHQKLQEQLPESPPDRRRLIERRMVKLNKQIRLLDESFQHCQDLITSICIGLYLEFKELKEEHNNDMELLRDEVKQWHHLHDFMAEMYMQQLDKTTTTKE